MSAVPDCRRCACTSRTRLPRHETIQFEIFTSCSSVGWDLRRGNPLNIRWAVRMSTHLEWRRVPCLLTLFRLDDNPVVSFFDYLMWNVQSFFLIQVQIIQKYIHKTLRAFVPLLHNVESPTRAFETYSKVSSVILNSA